MSRTNAENRANALRWSADLRRRAVKAVEAGQAVIAGGLRRRAPSRLPGLASSIRSRKVGSNPQFVGGFVVVEHPLARRVERRTPFIVPTLQQDGPRAIKVTLRVLMGGNQ